MLIAPWQQPFAMGIIARGGNCDITVEAVSRFSERV